MSTSSTLLLIVLAAISYAGILAVVGNFGLKVGYRIRNDSAHQRNANRAVTVGVFALAFVLIALTGTEHPIAILFFLPVVTFILGAGFGVEPAVSVQRKV